MGKTSAMNLFRRLEQLNGIGAALSRERDIERLLENILEAAKTLTGADGNALPCLTCRCAMPTVRPTMPWWPRIRRCTTAR